MSFCENFKFNYSSLKADTWFGWVGSHLQVATPRKLHVVYLVRLLQVFILFIPIKSHYIIYIYKSAKIEDVDGGAPSRDYNNEDIELEGDGDEDDPTFDDLVKFMRFLFVLLRYYSLHT